MTQRIEVGIRADVDDPKGRLAAQGARDFLGITVESIRTRTVFKLSFDLTPQELEFTCQALSDPIVEESTTGRLERIPADWVISIGFLPGVTDNLGRTARLFITDLIDRDLPPDAQVYTEVHYHILSPGLPHAEAQRLAGRLLANELIQRIKIWSAAEYQEDPDLELPLWGAAASPAAQLVPLPPEDQDLAELSRRRTLSLSIQELQAIRAHYARPEVAEDRRALGLGTDPTDVELECIAQTWSEHCKHKIFNARISYQDGQGGSETISSLFKSYIVEPTREIAQRVSWLISVFDDNAGIVRVAEDTHLVFKVETHNSPSALDPYGGAMTGIVGVNRDPLGTGMGARLLTNVWGYCLASPFHAGEIPQGLLHPRRIRDGVHQGVIDGGNQSGIPYSRGFEVFDQRYLGKPLVFCGTVGVQSATIAGQPSHVKEVRPGDHVVMLGGRIGKDGIHGATFSSEALHGESPTQAVQIGDPFTQKVMSDMLLEARDLGLYRTITDNGAGGLSSSVGELAQLSGGAELHLHLAPLKYKGLHPWEILVSEAQERMTLAVPPDRLPALMSLAARREVEATAIGIFTDSGSFRLVYEEQVVGELEMEFLHHGCPTMELEAAWDPPPLREPAELGLDLQRMDPAPLLGEMLARLNICSGESKRRRYDHEVKGLSVIKPLVGIHGDIPADAAAMRIEHGRPEAVLLAEGIAPRLSDLDAGAMAAYVVDLAVRRIIAGGGRLGQIAGLDNFCWPDPVQSASTPDGRHKLAGLVRACKAMATMCRGLDLPCISGKDSMKNDSTRGGVKISIPPTLLFSVMGWVDQCGRATDLVPSQGEALYIIGQTSAELGGSELLALLAEAKGNPQTLRHRLPAVTAESCREACAALQAAMDLELVSAAHAPHLGGLGVSLALLCLAGDLGLEASLDPIPGAPGLSDMELLYSECGSRFLFTAAPGHEQQLETLLAAQGAPWAKLGTFTAGQELHLQREGRSLLRGTITDLRTRYKETLDGI